jgi:hypothetical protein
VNVTEVLAAAPKEIPVSSSQPDLRYRLAGDVVALHAGNSGMVTVLAATDPAPPADAAIGPVYRRVPGGDVVVPTGRILIRFDEGEDAERHRDDVVGAGYEVEQDLPYAPHAAWVRPISGGIADSLRLMGRLGRIPGVRHVEPEMIGGRSLRR